MSKKLVLDAGILVEYIVAGSPYREFVEGLFSRSKRGELGLYVSAVTLAEVLYVASRIYSAAGIEDPNGEAENFVTWIASRAGIINVDPQIAKAAGELRKRFRIALPDCFVIATAIMVGGSALFKRVEREMRDIEEELRRLGAVFAEDYVRRGQVK